MSDVTKILSQIEQGDPSAADELLPLVYEELRKLAAANLAHEKPGQTLQATALVHEAYIRLIGPTDQGWDSRGHFFAAAAESMRRILIDSVRQKRAQRRGGDRERFDVSEADCVEIPPADELLDLDDALSKLEKTDPQAAKLVKLRVFAGMTVDEVAELQGVSARTAKRTWAYARAWLGRELGISSERE